MQGGALVDWGSGKPESALAGAAADAQRHVPFPQRLLPNRGIVKVVADVGVFACIDDRGTLLAWGNERQGFPAQPSEVRGGAPGAAGVVLKDHCFVDVAVRDRAVYGLSRSCAGPGAELGAVLSTTFVGGCQCDAGERRRCRGGTDSRGGARSPC